MKSWIGLVVGMILASAAFAFIWRAMEPSIIVRDATTINCEEQHRFPASIVCVPGVYRTSIHGKNFRVVVSEAP